MIDPPRSDSATTIQRLLEAGVEVKMVTGDHLNIAKETARLVGLSTNIILGEETRAGTYERDDLVRQTGGFASVLPKDKREVVQVLQKSFGLVVGMTGDGVNDAPALSCAQCGIAVADATDAARNAAAMILTEEGLSAVFRAVVESRKIYARLHAYVTYRLATTIQILVSLTLIVLAFNCEMNTLYIVLLALLNDVTMIPIAHDRQVASVSPVVPSVRELVAFSITLGLFQAAFTMVFYAFMDTWISGDLSPSNQAAIGDTLVATQGFFCNDYAQVALWLQISISAELLIFVTRSPGLFFLSRPSLGIIVSTLVCGVVLCSILAKYAFKPGLHWDDIGKIWAFDLVCMVILDLVKLTYKHYFEHGVEGIIDEAKYTEEDSVDLKHLTAAEIVPAAIADLEGAGDAKPPSLLSESFFSGPRAPPSMRTQRIQSASTPVTTAGRLKDFLATGRSMSMPLGPGTPSTPPHYSQIAACEMVSQDRRVFEHQRTLPQQEH